MPPPLAPFSLPDRYRLEGGIAAGGMAAVYAAHDTVLDRPVAVKVLAEHLNSDDRARRRFQREARAAAGLSSHPAVVTIFDVGEHEGRSFIVMERRMGGTVGDQLAAGPIEPHRALGWLRATADALDAAHHRGVVHRDIKPGNLLLDEHDRVAVADFGIARLAWEDQVTQTGQVLGTSSYISPEQALGDAATSASDRYALAVVAFELLTGRKPFEADHFAAQARAHIEDPVPSASARRPELPRAVDGVLRRGMAKDPGERWPSAGAFVDALAAALEGTPTEATRPLPPPPAAAPTAAHAAAATPPRRTAPDRRQPRPEPPRRRVPAALAAALALLVVAAGALAIGLGGGDDPSPRKAPTKPKRTAQAKRAGTPKATSTPTATATATPEATPAGGDPVQLNNAGYELFKAGRYGESVPFFQRALEACGDSTGLACAYATYNLGAALNRSGNPADAIPVLQHRLAVWPDNQPDTVRAELAAACKAAGADCGDGKVKGPKGPKGKAKGHHKDD